MTSIVKTITKIIQIPNVKKIKKFTQNHNIRETYITGCFFGGIVGGVLGG